MMKMDVVFTSEVRPCIVLEDGRVGLWHGFSDRYGNTIVEFKDGTVEVLSNPDSIRFLDSAEKFAEYGWTGTTGSGDE